KMITSSTVGVTVMRTWVEPVVAGSQVASAFYDTALLLVVKNYYNLTNTTAPAHALEDAQQKAVSNFYIIYNLVLGLSPLVSAYGLSKLGDSMHQKIPICFSLLGYLGSKTLLLLLILLGWPIEVMYGAAAFNGLTGGFTTFWAGIMALGSLGSSESRRSLRLIIVELVYGLAGFVGSMASGYLFVGFSDRYREGTVLVSCSIACYAFCLLYSIFVLTVPKAAASCRAKGKSAEEVGSQLPAHTGAAKAGSSQPVEISTSTPASPSKLIVAMLFVAAILYDLAVVGAMNVLPLFLLREPLSWNAVEIGYGNAAGYAIFITSFLGVFVFSKYLKDITMIMIGVVSFSAGILIMAFVRWTFLFYIARAVTLFALIPLPTIRSMLSKHFEGSSYGKVFVLLQLSLVTTGVVTSTVYNKIYQNTLNWYSSFCFVLSFLVSCLSLLPL
ncbi:TSCOT protein, partial [Bucorvus abyssinicus]|nr:TSCOT protein [Bucorvus abyssinicus]